MQKIRDQFGQNSKLSTPQPIRQFFSFDGEVGRLQNQRDQFRQTHPIFKYISIDIIDLIFKPMWNLYNYIYGIPNLYIYRWFQEAQNGKENIYLWLLKQLIYIYYQRDVTWVKAPIIYHIVSLVFKCLHTILLTVCRQIDVGANMLISNCIPLVYVNVIIYPCH